jgi:hypothetical protein
LTWSGSGTGRSECPKASIISGDHIVLDVDRKELEYIIEASSGKGGGMSGKERTAFHEAGDAVALLAQGLSFDRATIRADAERESLGSCLSPTEYGYDTHGTRERKQVARQIVIGCYAGQEAERLADPDADSAISSRATAKTLSRSCASTASERVRAAISETIPLGGGSGG